MKQEWMVKDAKDESRAFFFAHSFKTARQHAEEYLRRNSDNAHLVLYRANSHSFGPRWIPQN